MKYKQIERQTGEECPAQHSPDIARRATTQRGCTAPACSQLPRSAHANWTAAAHPQPRGAPVRARHGPHTLQPSASTGRMTAKTCAECAKILVGVLVETEGGERVVGESTQRKEAELHTIKLPSETAEEKDNFVGTENESGRGGGGRETAKGNRSPHKKKRTSETAKRKDNVTGVWVATPKTDAGGMGGGTDTKV